MTRVGKDLWILLSYSVGKENVCELRLAVSFPGASKVLVDGLQARKAL